MKENQAESAMSSQKPCIAFVIGSSQAYGAQKVGVGFARSIAARGYPVIVILPPKVEGDVPSIIPSMEVEGIKLFIEPGIQKGFAFSAVLRSSAIFRKYRPAVCVSFIQRGMRLSGPLCSLTGVPMVISIQNPAAASGSGWLRRLKLKYYGWVVSKVSKLNFCTSETLQKHLVDEFGVQSSRTRLLANGISVEALEGKIGLKRDQIRKEFDISETDFVFCFVGRLDYQKGIEFMIEALARVLPDRPQARLIVVGAPTNGSADSERYSKQLLEQVRNEGVEHRVAFAGWRNDAGDIIGESDCYLQASRFEGPAAPLPVLEAMVRSKPIIISDCSGFPPGFEQGREGFVTRVGDVDELAKRMREMIDLGSDDYDAMSSRSRELMLNEFDEDKIAGRFLDTLLNEVMASNVSG